MFCESEVLPLILRECCSESQNTLFFSMIVYLTKRAVEKSSLYAKTLGNIIKMIVDPPEGLYELVADFNRWKELLDVTINAHIDTVLKAEDSNDPEIRRRIEMIKIVSSKVKHLLSSLECYQEIRNKIINELDVTRESNIILYSSMIVESKWEDNTIQLMKQDPEDKSEIYYDVKALQKIMDYVSGLLDQKLQGFAALDAILESLNCAITKLGHANIFNLFDITYRKIRSFLKNALEYLIVEESVLEYVDDENKDKEEENYQPKNAILLNTIGINLLHFIQMIIYSLHNDDSEGTKSIVDGILEYSKIKAEIFNDKMNLLKDKIKETQSRKAHKPHPASEVQLDEAELSSYSKQIQELEYEVIECIGGVLNNLSPYVHKEIDEDVLYTLIGTHIENIQKAAYLTLVYFYENFIPPIKYKYDEKEELNEEELKERIEKEIAESEEIKEEEVKQAEVKQKRIKGEPDKNIAMMLLDIIESPPEFKDEAQQLEEEKLEESEDELLQEGYMDIQSASTLLDEKLMSNEIYSYLLAWNAMLNKISNAKMKLKFEQGHDYLRVINSLQEFLTMNQYVYEMFLVIIVAYLPTQIKQKWNPANILDCKPEWVNLNSQELIEEFALYSMYNFLANFPSLAREYYQDCDRRIYNVVYPIISKLISPAIMENEIRKIEISQADLNTQNLSFTLFKSTKEILADYVQGEVEVQLKLKIPNEYPLKSIEIKCTKQLKIPEMQLRRWMLSIRKMISSQNGDFISGILLWKSNIEKEIEGVEDCLICYSTVHVIDKSLPKLACKNCKNKFHAHCIKKWFAESQKSKCPMCQNYFW